MAATDTTAQHGDPENASSQLSSEPDSNSKALDLKDRGNQLYKEKKFLDAALCYTQGIQLDSSITTLHSNRSAVYIELAKRTKDAGNKRDLLDRALRDSAKSIDIDSNWEKGYLRLGGALEALGKHAEAAGAFQQGLKLNPESKDLKEKLGSIARGPSEGVETQSVILEPILEAWRGKSEEEEKAWIFNQLDAQKQKKEQKAGSSSSPSSSGPDNGPLAALGFREKPGAKDHPGRKFIHSGPPPLVPKPRHQEDYEDDDDDLQYTVIDHSARQREKERQQQPGGTNGSAAEKEGNRDGRRDGVPSEDPKGGRSGESAHPAEAESPKPGFFRRMLSSFFGARKPSETERQEQEASATAGDGGQEVEEFKPSPNPRLFKWAAGIGEDKMYEWFLDCYRFQESGGPDTVNADFHSPLCTRLALLPFLLFCKLAVGRGVLPPTWDWTKFLSVCKEEVWKKLSYDEALARYGRMVMLQSWGDESPNMITTAEHVYGCQAGMKMPEETKQVQREVSKAFYGWRHANSGLVFADVGGRGAWEWLTEKEPPPACNCKKSKWAQQFDVDKEEENDRWDKRWESKEDWAKVGDGEGM